MDLSIYFKNPGWSSDGLGKKSKMKLGSIKDPEVLLIIENGIRGTVFTITYRYVY